MKRFISKLMVLALAASCAPHNQSGSSAAPKSQQAEGGVDVGNLSLSLALVPSTNASLTYSRAWTATTAASLSLENKSGSKIQVRKAEIKDLSSPDALSMRLYLKAKFPDRDYRAININGLQGVRADLVDSADSKQSDIYLVSELKDFLHIESSLKKEDEGIVGGEEIIQTIRVEYRGEPVVNAKPKTVTLPAYSLSGGERMKAAYSFQSECYVYVDQGCRGVAVLFGNGGQELSVGAGGYDHGRIIELGSEKEIPFDSIKIEGKYLVAPLTKTSIADIYTAFTPKDQHPEVDRLEPKVGKVYLVRTISWPEEDLIVKMKVESVSGSALTITYEKLIYVKTQELKKQVDEINKYTIDNEKPLSEGEVTLHNRSIWNNYFYASFNFENSTSGNMFITHNGWDLLFSNNGYGKPAIDVPYTGSSIGQVVDFGDRDLSSLKKEDFPDPNLIPKYNRELAVEKGKIYGIQHFDYGGSATYGAVQVLDIAPDGNWIRLKFRRIDIGPVGHFQKWISLAVPAEPLSIRLEKNADYENRTFYPFTQKVGAAGRHYYENMSFVLGEGRSSPYLYVDIRPYAKGRGFFKLRAGLRLDQVTERDVESYVGLMDNRVDLKKGDLIAVYLENFYDKTVMIIRIDDLNPNEFVQMSARYLSRSKTQYSEDAD